MINITWLDGYAPVQAEGTFFGVPFYFRARGNYWAVTTAKDSESHNVFDGTMKRGGFFIEKKYSDNEFDASWMPHEDALCFITEAYKAFKAERGQHD